MSLGREKPQYQARSRRALRGFTVDRVTPPLEFGRLNTPSISWFVYQRRCYWPVSRGKNFHNQCFRFVLKIRVRNTTTRPRRSPSLKRNFTPLSTPPRENEGARGAERVESRRRMNTHVTFAKNKYVWERPA